MAGAWIPWQLLLPFLPAGAADLVKEEERQRRREELVQALQEHSKTALKWALRFLQAGLVVSLLLVTATLLYSLLYYLVIPSRLHEQEIFFDYGNHASLKGPDNAQLTLPIAKLDLLNPEHQWEASTRISSQPAEHAQALVPGLTYDIFVELELPESRVNLDIGMFMIGTTLRTQNGTYLASSTRPAIVHDSPTLTKCLRELVWAIPQALGLVETTQHLHLLAINGYTESHELPLTTIVIGLNHPELQVYSAKLTIIAQLSGVRYLMYHWSVPTAILVILNIMFIEAMGLVMLYAFYNLRLPEEEAVDAAATAVTTVTTMPMATMDENKALSEPLSRAGDSLVMDQGKQFEENRSGGIPPVHVERSIKTEQIETSVLLDQASAGNLLDLKREEEMQLRYRTSTSSSM